jgi:hypothetical protein
VAELDDVTPRDAVEAVLAPRSAHRSVADDEEIGGVAARDEPVGIEHQRFVGARIHHLEQRLDQVQAAVAVETHVERLRAAGAERRSRQHETPPIELGRRRLELGRDDHGRGAEGLPGILVGRSLDAAGHHEPQVRAIAHAVGRSGAYQGIGHALAIEADVEPDLRGAAEQPVEVLVEEGKPAVDHPEPFPDAVAEHEAGIEHRHHGLSARHQPAIHPDQQGLVARVGREGLAAAAGLHGRAGASRCDARRS